MVLTSAQFSFMLHPMIKKILLILLLAASVQAAEIPPLADSYVNRFADVIYKIEGGERARKPYGVLSVKVNSKEQARRVTINSIRNNWKRWHKAGKPGDFITFMANSWCPPSADPVGNRNWIKNAKFYMNRS